MNAEKKKQGKGMKKDGVVGATWVGVSRKPLQVTLEHMHQERKEDMWYGGVIVLKGGRS